MLLQLQLLRVYAIGMWWMKTHRITKVKEIFPRNKHWIILARVVEPFTIWMMHEFNADGAQRPSQIMANWTQVNEAKPKLSYAKLSKAIFRSDTSIPIWMHFMLRLLVLSSFISLHFAPHQHIKFNFFLLHSFYFSMPIVDVHQSIHIHCMLAHKIHILYRMMKWPVQAKNGAPQPMQHTLHTQCVCIAL